MTSLSWNAIFGISNCPTWKWMTFFFESWNNTGQNGHVFVSKFWIRKFDLIWPSLTWNWPFLVSNLEMDVTIELRPKWPIICTTCVVCRIGGDSDPGINGSRPGDRPNPLFSSSSVPAPRNTATGKHPSSQWRPPLPGAAGVRHMTGRRRPPGPEWPWCSGMLDKIQIG